MPTQAAMQFLGEVDGFKFFWAKPGLFTVPGVYFWDGAKNVHVDPRRHVFLEACQDLPAPQAELDLVLKTVSVVCRCGDTVQLLLPPEPLTGGRCACGNSVRADATVCADCPA